MKRLEGKVAVISGGARGIGAAMVRRFAAEGAKVLIADRRVDQGEELAAEVGEAAAYHELDVASESGWDALVDDVTDRWGGIDVLVNNAGINRVGPLVDCTLDTFRMVLDVNLVGTFLGIRAAARSMGPRGGGSIINLSSPQGVEGREGMAAYTASKFGIRGLTRTAAIELGPLGIRVNGLIPGPIRTAMTDRRDWTEDDYRRAYGGYPLGRRGEPEEVAAAAAFLASEDAAYCTGSDLVVDGGVLAGKPLATRTEV
ncbi:MAG: family oxidoreductase [Acidimicrobiales bacterium]|nr:family oxidoreductase [Acidimicrobiales bacterium]